MKTGRWYFLSSASSISRDGLSLKNFENYYSQKPYNFFWSWNSFMGYIWSDLRTKKSHLIPWNIAVYLQRKWRDSLALKCNYSSLYKRCSVCQGFCCPAVAGIFCYWPLTSILQYVFLKLIDHQIQGSVFYQWYPLNTLCNFNFFHRKCVYGNLRISLIFRELFILYISLLLSYYFYYWLYTRIALPFLIWWLSTRPPSELQVKIFTFIIFSSSPKSPASQDIAGWH